MVLRPSSSSKKDLPMVPEEQGPFLRKGLFSRSKSAQPHYTSRDSTPSHPSPASPNNNTQSISRTTTHRVTRTLNQSHTPLDLSADYVPMERSRSVYTPQPNPPTEQKMMPKTLLTPSSLDAYPSRPHEEFDSPSQVIRLECSPRENGQIYHNDFQPSAASYIEASYQPPPPIHATYQPPLPPQTSRNNARRALPVPGKAARASPTLEAHPPSYPSPTPPTHAGSRFLPSPPTSPPNFISSSQSFSRSQSPTFTELPDYSSGRASYSPGPTGRRPLQIPLKSASPPPAIRLEYTQHSETTLYQSPSTAQPPRTTSSLVRVPDHLIQHTNISTDNDSNLWHSGRGNGSSATSSPRRNAFHLPVSSLSQSGSSDSSGGKSSSISSGVPNVSPAPFIYPGSRSVARPKASPKIKSPPKSWRWRDSIRKSPLSEIPASVPSAATAPSSPKLPTRKPSKATTASTVSSNSKDGLPKFPGMTYYETSSVFSDESRETATTTSSGNASPVHIYPAGRSRAQPKLAPSESKGQFLRRLSGGASGGETERKKTGFLGMLLKKKTKAPKSVDGSNGTSTGSSVKSEPTKQTITPPNENNPESYQVMQATAYEESREQANRIKSRIGSYPLDPYDSVLLDNDRHTGELLARLNPTGSPSFHNYGNTPPTSVLDLGCGQGHWVVDAAIAWKGYGTKVTGYDMVDVSKALLPWVIEQGITGSVQFVRGNFLRQRLPFSNDSFDLVRMSCLALCITSDSWIFVLQEVYRVLMVGGRLELIDDHIFFPYGKESTSLGIPDSALNSQAPSIAPRLNISIPSSSFTTFSIYDGETNNPGLGLAVDNKETKDYELYEVEEEDIGDTETLNGRNDVHALAGSPHNSRAPPRTRMDTSRNFDANLGSWTHAHNTSEDLEALFEHMILHKFGINKNPNEFVLGLMNEVFGHAREIKTMHLTLAPPKTGIDLGGSRFGRSSRRESMGLSQAPGLVLCPSTFIPMDQTEIEIHASKHLRMLLSCKTFLLEHAIEVTDDEEVDQRAVLEALEEYESFLRRRFDPPALFNQGNDDQCSETASSQGSIAESVSSDGLDAMREIESELRPRFSWQDPASQDRLVLAASSTPNPVDQLTAPQVPSPASNPTTVTSKHCLRGATDASNAPPTSSCAEATHVRTFRIYEAIKIDETIFGSSALGLSGLSS